MIREMPRGRTENTSFLSPSAVMPFLGMSILTYAAFLYVPPDLIFAVDAYLPKIAVLCPKRDLVSGIRPKVYY